MTINGGALNALDSSGYTVLEALTSGGLAPTRTHARPTTFAAIDGKKYWVKATAQQGLVAELIAGRLGAKVGASPVARIVRVTAEAVPSTGEANHLLGVVVGIEDVPEAVNGRDLGRLTGRAQFQPNLVDGRSRARVIAFQTWLGVGDTQVLVRLTDGIVFSIDHGECFGTTGNQAMPSVVVAAIPGVPDSVGKRADDVQAAVSQIAAVTDDELLDAVAKIPAGEPWRSPPGRRLEIANWLAYRRDHLAEVMDKWVRT